MPIHRARLAALVALAIVQAAACGRPDSAPTERPKEDKVEMLEAPPVAPAVTDQRDFSGRGVAGGVANAPQGFAALSTSVPAATPAPAPPGQPPSAAATDTTMPAARMVIRDGVASIEVDSLERAIAQVRAMAARLGGFVADASLQTGRDQVRSSSLQLKVPAARFDEAIGGLAPIGRVETVNVTAEDVGEEYVDVAARVANSRRLEARLVALLERSVGRLSDVLAVERELARVREEIERAEGRMRYLRTRVALSTLAVTVHEPPPIVGTSPAASPIGDAFVQAWRNFVAFVAGLIAASGVLVPLAGLAALGVWLVRRWMRRRPPRAARGSAVTAERKDA